MSLLERIHNSGNPAQYPLHLKAQGSIDCPACQTARKPRAVLGQVGGLYHAKGAGNAVQPLGDDSTVTLLQRAANQLQVIAHGADEQWAHPFCSYRLSLAWTAAGAVRFLA